MFDDKYLKTKIKSYKNKTATKFYGKTLKEGIKCVFLSVIVINSVFKSGKNCYPQIFLEEWKYSIKEKKIKSFIKYDLESSSVHDSGEEENVE